MRGERWLPWFLIVAGAFGLSLVVASTSDAHGPWRRQRTGTDYYPTAVANQGGAADAGFFEIVLWLSASYGNPTDNEGPPFYTTAQRCPDDASVCAWRMRDGAIEPAVEPTNDGGPLDSGITPQVGAAQVLARALGRPVILIDRAFSGTPVAGYSTTTMLEDLDNAVAYAADAGSVARVRILTDNSGGYNEVRAGDPFADYISDLEVHRTAINNRIAARVDAGVAGWTNFTPTLALNSGTAHNYGVSGIPRHLYANDFVDHTNDVSNGAALCGQLYYVETGADELHPNQAGGIAMADLYGRCWARMLQANAQSPAASLRSVSVLDADSIRATFYVPCRAEGTCLDDPPLTTNTTDVVLQESTSSNIDTYGFHFYDSGGTLLTPGAASTVTFASCPAPATLCDVTVDFASLPNNFAFVSYADTGAVNTAISPTNPRGSGGNFLARLSAALGGICGADSPCADWTVSNFLAASAYDSGVHADAAADAGVADAAPEDAGAADAAAEDAAPSDSGIHPDAAVDAGPDSGPDAGEYNNGYFLESDGGYLELAANNTPLNLLSTFSICLVARTDTAFQFQPPYKRWLFGVNMIWLFGNIGGEWVTGIEQTLTGFDIDSPTISSGTWTHLCMAYDNSATVMYVDGVARSMDAGVTVNGSPPATITDDNVVHQILGDSVGAYVNTDVDSIVFYSDTITQAQADSHRCAFTTITNIDGGANPCSGQSLGQVVFDTDFVEAYLFDDPDAGPGRSYSGNNDFTVNGTLLQTASPLP